MSEAFSARSETLPVDSLHGAEEVDHERGRQHNGLLVHIFGQVRGKTVLDRSQGIHPQSHPGILGGIRNRSHPRGLATTARGMVGSRGQSQSKGGGRRRRQRCRRHRSSGNEQAGREETLPSAVSNSACEPRTSDFARETTKKFVAHNKSLPVGRK